MDSTGNNGNEVVLVAAPDFQFLYVNGKLEMQDERLEFRHVMPVLLANNWNYGMKFKTVEVGLKWTGETEEDLKVLKFSTQI